MLEKEKKILLKVYHKLVEEYENGNEKLFKELDQALAIIGLYATGLKELAQIIAINRIPVNISWDSESQRLLMSVLAVRYVLDNQFLIPFLPNNGYHILGFLSKFKKSELKQFMRVGNKYFTGKTAKEIMEMLRKLVLEEKEAVKK